MKDSSALLRACLAALPIGLAWWGPGSLWSAVLTWIGIFFFIFLLHNTWRPYLSIYIFGTLLYMMGFHWLNHTISHLGGFGMAIGGSLFLLFCLVSACQFLLVLLTYRSLPHALDRFALRGTFAYICWEFAFPKIFPWQLAHTQIAIVPLVQSADLIGGHGISFIVFWLCEAIYLSVKERTLLLSRASSLAVLLAALTYGFVRLASVHEAMTAAAKDSFTVTIVQANTPLEEKHDRSKQMAIIRQHNLMSQSATAQGELLVWPETVLNMAIPSSLRSVRQIGISTVPENGSLLMGTLVKDAQTGGFYNSALGADATGQVSGFYHKQILMPFGEYTPFASTFPILRDWNRGIADFDAGKSSAPITLAVQGKSVQVSSLICYEDVVDSLAREAVREGAELLVNLTNDAWFGETIAPEQHHLIATFRAVETKRFLVRATNTGLSAVVDPLGRTIARIDPFRSGTLKAEVVPLTISTLYSRIGNVLWWCLLAICACPLLLSLAIKRKSPES